MVRPTLAIVAFRETRPEAVEALLHCLLALRQTAPEAQVLVIEDREPAPHSLAEAAAAELGCAYVPQEDGAGLVAATAAGLEVALTTGADAALIGPDVAVDPSWLERLQARRDTQGRPAAVVGGRIRYADGLIEEAGYFYSMLLRRWLPRFAGVPAEVAETAVPTLCPVSGRLALVRNETLAAVGLLDPELEPVYADLDLCLRAFAAGLECVHEPTATGRTPNLAEQGLKNETSPERIAGARLEARHDRALFDRFIPDVI